MKAIATLVILLISTIASFGQLVNIQKTELKEGHLEIYYELRGDQDKYFNVSFFNSTDLFKVASLDVVGDVGEGIKPGTGKVIHWLFAEQGIDYDTTIQIRIKAIYQPNYKKRKSFIRIFNSDSRRQNRKRNRANPGLRWPDINFPRRDKSEQKTTMDFFDKEEDFLDAEMGLGTASGYGVWEPLNLMIGRRLVGGLEFGIGVSTFVGNRPYGSISPVVEVAWRLKEGLSLHYKTSYWVINPFISVPNEILGVKTRLGVGYLKISNDAYGDTYQKDSLEAFEIKLIFELLTKW